MSGILVGVDGSDNSQRALEWAAKEAAFRQTSLTVLAVHQAVHADKDSRHLTSPSASAALGTS